LPSLPALSLWDIDLFDQRLKALITRLGPLDFNHRRDHDH